MLLTGRHYMKKDSTATIESLALPMKICRCIFQMGGRVMEVGVGCGRRRPTDGVVSAVLVLACAWPPL